MLRGWDLGTCHRLGLSCLRLYCQPSPHHRELCIAEFLPWRWTLLMLIPWKGKTEVLAGHLECT